MAGLCRRCRSPRLWQNHTTGTKHALACGNMTLAWRKWRCCPPINHTCPNWKAHWTAAFAKMCDINCMTDGNTVFGANQAAELN
jgi:hypothetical protein